MRPGRSSVLSPITEGHDTRGKKKNWSESVSAVEEKGKKVPIAAAPEGEFT